MFPKVRDYQDVHGALRELDRRLFEVTAAGLQKTNPTAYPVFVVSIAARKRPSLGPIYLSGGIHGDEPAGVWAALEFFQRFPDLPPYYHRFNYTVLPCINPYGFEHNTRANHDAIDLNRQFRNADPPEEVRIVKNAAGNTKYRIAMEFHEDIDTPAFYLYELAQPGEPPWGRKIVDRIRLQTEVNDQEVIEGMPADHGLIARESAGRLTEDVMTERPDWPQAFFHYSNGSRHCYTTETPVHLAPPQRAAIHLTALDAAVDCLWEQLNPPKP
jgi:hypothetical protein